MRFLLVLAWRTDRRRLLSASLLMLVGYLATPMLGLLLKGLTEAMFGARPAQAILFGLGAALLLIFELMLGHFAHLYYFELGERMGARLDAHLTEVTHGRPGLEHLDSPSFHDNLTLVRQDILLTRQGLEGILHLSGLVIRASMTTAILAWVDPRLALLPIAAVPGVLIARKAQALLDTAKENHAPDIRRNAHFVELATSSDAAKEVRLFGAAPFLLRRQASGWTATSAALWQAHLRSAALRSCGQLLFALAYGTAIMLVLWRAVVGTATIGDVVLVVTLAVQISVQISNALGLMGTLQAASRMASRLRFLADFPAPPANGSPGPLPLVLDKVGFAYPGGVPLLRDISLTIPAGTVVAIVGENGAGKSTLVKLLCGLYQPTSGTITPALPRDRQALLFQDFAKLQLFLRESVGVGDLVRMYDDAAVSSALATVGATSISDRVGLDGLLGRSYGDGQDLSGGQWQSLGLARTLMRPTPLLLALDEPAAALDAQAEHALFERFAAAAPPDAVTLFVSHRFSTVRMAGLIVVLKDGRLLEQGSHDQLIAAGGLYAELFTLQARVYSV